ncbi:MAG: proline--tRNA ligase [Fibrobacterales bacterium]
MLVSKLFYTTLRETPSDAVIPSHIYLLRGGYIKQLSTGIYSILPMGLKVLRKIEAIIREEMTAIDGQEVDLPVVHPKELWLEADRYDSIGNELLRFQDRTKHDMVLAMTHEEAITDLARHVLSSYKQLPFMLWQFKTKFRDEARPRAGLIRVKEFIMKDGYSFHSSTEDLDTYYTGALDAYTRIFNRVGIDPVIVESDTGIMGGKQAHEFMLETPNGEDYLILCDACGYQANAEIAEFARSTAKGDFLELEKVATPDTKTINEIASLLKVTPEQTLKAVYYESEGSLYTVLIQGNLEVSETKVKNILKLSEIHPASDELIRTCGMEPGYASPIGAKNTFIIADWSVIENTNLVTGANEEGYHYLNSNIGRDYHVDKKTDIAQADSGCACRSCGASLRATRGIEIGNIFKLGTKFSNAMGATFLDESGKKRPVVMGCYGIGVGRLMASVAETYHDKWGLKWPAAIAPYSILISTIGKEEEGFEKSLALYKSLTKKGIDVLWDDRKERPGVKFKDADLWGIPLRITIGGKALQEGAYEWKIRSTEDKEMIAEADIMTKIDEYITQV